MAFENIKQMQMVQDVAQSPTLRDDMEVIRPEVKRAIEADQATMQGQRLAPPPIMADIPPELRKLETEAARQIEQQGGLQSAPMNTQAPIPQFVPEMSQPMDIKQNLNEVLTATLPDGDSIAAKALESLLGRSGTLVQGVVEMSQQLPETIMAESGGGLMNLAAGGEFTGIVPGDGHGMEDNVYMPIKEGEEQVATLAVSPTEYVVDSYTMAALGNGNPIEGADIMDEVVKDVRREAYGTDKQPNEINGLAALKTMKERV